MEVSVFPKPEVSRELARFVEIRLHTDIGEGVKYRPYQERLTGSIQLPNYAIIDPREPERVVSLFQGSILPGSQDFLEWLKQN